MAVSDPEGSLHAAFRGLLPEQIVARSADRRSQHCGARNSSWHERADEIAAIIVEPLVQGAGGMRFHDASVLKTLRALADRYELLLIFDEIFTGFGRTGAMFAFQDAGVAPDIVTLSKALTGGTLPLAATIASRKVFDAFWSDDPTAGADARADLHGKPARLRRGQCLARPVRARAAARSGGEDRGRFATRPRALPRASAASKTCGSKGAIGVVELDRIENLNALRQRFIAEGVFIRPFGNIVYLTPAFTIAEDELAALTGAIRRVLSKQR